jgi:parallel beta-helix repeat protein
MPDQPITFTSDQELSEPGAWKGLHFVAGSSDSQLFWCLVEYATTGVRVYAGPGETVGPAFSDCTMRYNSLYGILIEGYTSACDVGLAKPTIIDCLVEHNGVEEEGGCGIYGYGHGDPDNGCATVAAGSVGGVVTGSVIRQNRGTGIYLEARLDKMGHGDVWIAIEANTVWGNSGPGLHLDDLYGDDPVGSRIENNVIYANAGAGLLSDAKHEETDLFVVNNTIVGNAGDGVVFHRSAAQVRLANNIISENAGYGLVCTGDPVTQAANNDLWANADGEYVGCPEGTDDISADPTFVNRAAADFHLAFASPCIDAGTGEGAPATDIEGIARSQGEGVDIGAHELWYQYIYLPLALRE